MNDIDIETVDNSTESMLNPDGTELGEFVGIIKKSFKITNDWDQEVDLVINFDFSTMPNKLLIDRLVAKTVVSFQNGGKRRSMSREALEGLNGLTVMAKTAGHKIETKEEQIKKYVSTFKGQGMSTEAATRLAEKLVNNPKALEQVI